MSVKTANAARRLIKKYANRRLYDSCARRYVTADDLRKLIIAGEDILVRDDTSGEDITRLLLLQIISEHERSGSAVLDNQFLVSIIRFYDHPMQQVMRQYLLNSIDAFTTQQQLFNENMQSLMEQSFAPEAAESAARANQANTEAWQKMQSMLLKKSEDSATASANKD